MARGHRVLEAERAADRDDGLADGDARGRRELEGLEQGGVCVDVQDGQVGGRVGPDDRCGAGFAVREPHLDALGALDDVLVRHDVPLFVVDEPGALSLGRAAGLAERVALAGRGDRDLDDGRVGAQVQVGDRAGRGARHR